MNPILTLTLCFTTLFISPSLSFSQTIEFVIYDSLTQASVSEADISIWKNGAINQFLTKTDEAGSAAITLPDSICDNSKLNIRINHPAYVDRFASCNCAPSRPTIVDISLLRPVHNFDSFPIITYDIGAIIPSDSIQSVIAKLGALCMRNPSTTFNMQFEYSSADTNGYNLSLKRANFILHQLRDYGFSDCNLLFSVSQSKQSIMTIEIERPSH